VGPWSVNLGLSHLVYFIWFSERFGGAV